MPVAVKLFVDPMVTHAVLDVMKMAVNTGAVTVKVTLLAVMPLDDAVTVVLPCANVKAVLEYIVATAVSLDDQITDPETSPVVPSEYVPVAVNVTGVPLGVDGVMGLMLSPVITAAGTVRMVEGEVMPLSKAVTVVVPAATPVATPVVLLIVATLVLPDAQVTWLVTSVVVPSV